WNDVLGMVPGLDGGRVPNALSRVVIARCGIGSSGGSGSGVRVWQITSGGRGRRTGRAMREGTSVDYAQGRATKVLPLPARDQPPPRGLLGPLRLADDGGLDGEGKDSAKGYRSGVGVLPPR